MDRVAQLTILLLDSLHRLSSGLVMGDVRYSTIQLQNAINYARDILLHADTESMRLKSLNGQFIDDSKSN
jgi:hypothetical protein